MNTFILLKSILISDLQILCLFIIILLCLIRIIIIILLSLIIIILN